ncbi:11197_t:CDS:2, partial [Acaulospora colombiana]
TGSAAINLNKNGTMQRTPITGFYKVSLMKMLCSLGQTPSTYGLPLEGAVSLDEIRKKADRPVVVFPECTTSNGRGLLRFAEVFDPATPIPVKQYNVFIIYDSPTHCNPTATRSIPSPIPVPLPEPLIQLLTIPFEPSPLSIRLLPLSESPSAGSFLSSDIFAAGGVRDTLTEACSVL